MEDVILTQDMLDEINDEIACHLEKLSLILGKKITIKDTDWQVVYDLSVETQKSLECLGFNLK